MGGMWNPSLQPYPGDEQSKMATSFPSTSRIAATTRLTGQNFRHHRPPPAEMELLRATTPTTLDEARSQIDALRSAALKLEAVAKAELHPALTREKPAKRSRAMLSKSRYITQANLEGARRAKETPPSTRRRKSKNSTKEAPY